MQKLNRVTGRIYLVIFILSVICSMSLNKVSYASVSKLPRLNVKNLSLTRNSTYKLRLYNMSKDYTVSFESSDTGVVFIKSTTGKSCRIKAKSSGQSVITATVSDADNVTISELKCRVTVTPPAVSVKFCKKKITMKVGQTQKVKVSKKPLSSFEQPRFMSDNPYIASVSSNGTITANAAGKTTIRVWIANGKGGSCKVTVMGQYDNQKPTDNPDTDINPLPTETPSPSPGPSEPPKPQPTSSKTDSAAAENH